MAGTLNLPFIMPPVISVTKIWLKDEPQEGLELDIQVMSNCKGYYNRDHDSGLIQKRIGSAMNVRLYYMWLKSTTGLSFEKIQTHLWPSLIWGQASYFNP
jgi:hypothetical protein